MRVHGIDTKLDEALSQLSVIAGISQQAAVQQAQLQAELQQERRRVATVEKHVLEQNVEVSDALATAKQIRRDKKKKASASVRSSRSGSTRSIVTPSNFQEPSSKEGLCMSASRYEDPLSSADDFCHRVSEFVGKVDVLTAELTEQQLQQQQHWGQEQLY